MMLPADETRPAARRFGEAGAPSSPRSSNDAAGAADLDEFDVEAALLALSEDMGGPMTDVDLSALSPTERQVLLRYLRERLGLAAPV